MAGVAPSLVEGACSHSLLTLEQSERKQAETRSRYDLQMLGSSNLVPLARLHLLRFHSLQNSTEPSELATEHLNQQPRGKFQIQTITVRNTSRNLQLFPGVWVILIPRLAVIQLPASCFPTIPKAPPPKTHQVSSLHIFEWAASLL